MEECQPNSTACQDYAGISDSIDEYWDGNDDFTSFLVLNDINDPYSCNQWGDFGKENIPLIVDGDQIPIVEWFGFSTYPQNVLISPNMEILEINDVHPTVFSMAEFVGNTLGGCVDNLALNFGDDSTCMYESSTFTNYNVDILEDLGIYHGNDFYYGKVTGDSGWRTDFSKTSAKLKVDVYVHDDDGKISMKEVEVLHTQLIKTDINRIKHLKDATN